MTVATFPYESYWTTTSPPDDTDAPKSHRCPWASDPLLAAYHDAEWGVPVHDDRLHFELLTLEGAQAGLSWRIVLAKRAAYRKAFKDFDPLRVARMSPSVVDRLVTDAGLVRHRGKLESVLTNARAFIEVQQSTGSFDSYVWEFVGDKPIVHRFSKMSALPSTSPVAERLSKDLRRRGFRFVGPTICYSYLQAAGLVNDHLVGCPRWKALLG